MEVECSLRPTEYRNPGDYLTIDSDGYYYLDFTLTLKNAAAVGVSDTKYVAKLFVDEDSDGKYETDEELRGLIINRVSDNAAIASDALNLGSAYKIRCKIPEGYVGCLPWKLVFSQNGEVNITRSVSGFSAIPAKNKPTIKVLQLGSAWGNERFDLRGNLDTTLSESIKLSTLFRDIQDFNIDVTYMSVTEYVNNHTNDYYEYLSGFDMLVLGFTDIYRYYPGDFRGEDENYRNSVLAIRKYTLSGRSVLFTHDLTYFDNRGYYINTYLRDVQGMDRFGITYDILGNNSYINSDKSLQYEFQYDKNYGIKSSGNTVLYFDTKHGYSDNIILWRNNSLKFGSTNRRASNNYNSDFDVMPKDKDSSFEKPETITMINEGQVTRYPYSITSLDAPTFRATNTHSQYYQLNLDTLDSYWLPKEERANEIEGDDITVWYVIGNREKDDLEGAAKSVTNTNYNYYRAIQKDVRNDYYLYSRGNVFYTGAGHSFVGNEKERKLFVNTIVAAYSAGVHAPTVDFKENGYSETSKRKNSTISSIYLPYDSTVNQFVGSASENTKITVSFRTKNPNIRNSSKSMYAKFYMAVSDEAEATIKIEGKYYKEIGVRFKSVDGETVEDLVKRSDGSYAVENYTTYSLEFDVNELGLNGSVVHDFAKSNLEFYVRLGLSELESGNDVQILPASESMNGLNIFCTELLELE